MPVEWGFHLPMTDESLTVQRCMAEDHELLRQIKQGDTERFREVIDRYQQHVGRIVRRRVPADHVEELVHDVFVRAYSGLTQFSEKVSLDHWLAGIAVRTCYDFWRMQRRREIPVSNLAEDHHRWIERVLSPQSEETFRDEVKHREAQEVLAWALDQLSPENRAVVTLVHLDGYSVREAAALLGWSVVNVKVRSHRARQALRKILSGSLRGEHHETTE
ncbi:RNA polymerase sigma factor [Nitrospira sp. KM1]|uniref:RNA polymerase sigma factor n=1 Tax=Nitrospira sp. KM1 TaxID=1936990 RepID=UPI0015667ECF|nr:RNA polymerase sigma factor [Nitrospira sp. KM1]